MAIDVKIPAVGEAITEGTLARWLKKEGDQVQEGEPLFELETEKATGEVPSPASGRLQIKVKEGETVAIGAVVGSIETDKEAAPPKAERPKEPPKEAKPPPPREEAYPPREEAPPRWEEARPERSPAKPAVKKPEVRREAPPEKPAPPPPPEAEAPSPTEVVTASPPIPERRERESRQPMSRIRKTIAERLVTAQRTAAILTTFNEADMSQILAIRSQYKDIFRERHGVSLGFMSFFIKASVEALKAFPVVNAFIDGEDIVYHNYYDIGVAVSTERGLMVPVIRDADHRSFAEIEKAIAEFARKARDGKITVDELRGGTFTITNGGVFGSLLSTPILNPPQSAILGMHAIQKRPVVVDDQLVIRPMMYLALSYDHRLIDGREAVLFLRRVKECIENPQRLLLGL